MINTIDLKKWFPYNLKKSYKPYKVFCFHHAGGSVSIFRNWLKFNPLVEIVPVEIPGRSIRIKESCITNFDELIKETSQAIVTQNSNDNRPTFIYGHSLGGIIAFQTTYVLRNSYNMDIKKLIVAGRHAPMDKDPVTYRSYMGIEKLKNELLRIGATPKALIENSDFAKIMLPMIFNDYKLHESYKYHGEVLDIPIVALSGKYDTDADFNHMKNWSKVTSSNFKQIEFKGGHFFPYEDTEKSVLKALLNEITFSNNVNSVAFT